MTKNILIIDDDMTLSEELTEVIRDEGYKVSVVNDGDIGLKMIDRGDYDLVLLDLKMQKLNGIEVLKKLKGRKRKFKIVVLTGRPLEGDTLQEGGLKNDEKNALQTADTVMGKPFEVEDLVRKIHEIINDS
jgi:DNA-binding response OmpR family regulator